MDIIRNIQTNNFIRNTLLIALLIYIVFRILGAMNFFVEEINCGAEKVVEKDKKEYFSANGYRFDNAIGRSNEKSFEGIYSVKLTPDNEFGMSITLGTPKPKEEYEASVWFFENKTSLDTMGWPFLVASVGKEFWKGTIDIVERKNEWSKLHLKIIIPEEEYNQDPLVIYCWNNTKNDVYFDNMTIKRKNYWKFFRQ